MRVVGVIGVILVIVTVRVAVRRRAVEVVHIIPVGGVLVVTVIAVPVVVRVAMLTRVFVRSSIGVDRTSIIVVIKVARIRVWV